MKKITVVFFILIICMSLEACSGHSKRNQAIKQINNNCDVPFALTLSESALQNTDEYVKSEGFGCYSLENDDVSFTIGGYPDCLDKYHIIEYQIKSSKYTLMGLQVGCSLDVIDEIMKQNGYTISTEDNWWSRYTKNGVRVGIGLSDDVVAIFHVSVEVTNKNNISY